MEPAAPTSSARTASPSTLVAVERWALHQQGRDLVARVAAALGQDDVGVMPLKGVLLGALGIVHPADRGMRDVDVLIDVLGEAEAVRRLARHGFEVRDVPSAPGAGVALSHPSCELWVDLHTRISPFGLGRAPRRYLFETARADSDLFGARVLLPTRERLAVHLIVNMIKDRVVNSHAATPTDCAAVLSGCSAGELDAIARDLGRMSLKRGATRALWWVRQRNAHPAVDDLLHRLGIEAADHPEVARDVERLERLDGGGIVARLRGRAAADDLSLRVLSLLGLSITLTSWPLRDRWLRLQASAPR